MTNAERIYHAKLRGIAAAHDNGDTFKLPIEYAARSMFNTREERETYVSAYYKEHALLKEHR